MTKPQKNATRPASLAVKYRKVSDLIPHARNARTHSDAQVAQIAASIREFGWTNPILIDADSGIIAGHGRVLAARKLKMETVPTISITHLTAAQRRALVIADNKLALNAGWDEEMLTLELGDLLGEGFDLGLTGFDEAELEALFNGKATKGLKDPDDVPPEPQNPVTRLGDVWILGRHRIICGDATDASTVEKLLGAVKPHLMVTDPPYGGGVRPGVPQRKQRQAGRGEK